MDVVYPGFGRIIVDGTEYDHDVVIEDGQVRKRDKGPSKALRSRYGHTPLSGDESIPWTAPRLIIGTGASGRLPVVDSVIEAAEEHGVEVTMLPTADASALLQTVGAEPVNAILHVTC